MIDTELDSFEQQEDFDNDMKPGEDSEGELEAGEDPLLESGGDVDESKWECAVCGALIAKAMNIFNRHIRQGGTSISYVLSFSVPFVKLLTEINQIPPSI